MWPAFPVSDYYESSANPSPIEATFPSQVDGPSPVHMPDSDIVVRLPVAVFMSYCQIWCSGAESSGDLIDVCYLDSVFEFYSRDYLGQVRESA